MTMRTDSTIIDAIRRHASETYPEECCGFLLGTASPDRNEVCAISPAENYQDQNRERRYAITPAAYRDAERVARRDGLEIVGFYHSHPDHPALPSGTDLSEATFPGYTYAIQSVRNGRPAELTAWSLAPDRSEFQPEPVEIVEAMHPSTNQAAS